MKKAIFNEFFCLIELFTQCSDNCVLLNLQPDFLWVWFKNINTYDAIADTEGPQKIRLNVRGCNFSAESF